MSFKLSLNSISFILILVSFVFLLLATISSPVVKSFNLGHTADYTYGIFGYCWDNNSQCSSATYPIKLSDVDDSTSNWILNNNTRDTLAKIFIIAPIALGFNFVLLVLIFASHFSNKGVNLIAIVVNVLAMILTILVTIIIILVFYPNLHWTSWILLGAAAATIFSLIFLILNLITLKRNDDNDSDTESGFDKFANYGQLDDKFNHIQTLTFKSPNSTSSIENEYNYKQYDSTMSNVNSFSNTNSNLNNDSGFINKGYNNPPPIRTHNGSNSFTSQSSSCYSKPPQTVNDFTNTNSNSVASGYRPTGTTGVDGSTTSNNPPYPASTPKITNDSFSRSVFEHHPQVEGHKPFTELEDDFDDEEDLTKNNQQQSNDSDDDSDFTSVSQRAPNPQYTQQQQQQQQQQQIPVQRNYNPQYQNVQQYQPMYQQTPPQSYQQQVQPHYQSQPQPLQYPQQYNTSVSPQGYYSSQQRPTISDNVLNSNPDFNFARGQPQAKRRVSPGFVPVAARYKNQQSNNNASQLMGRNAASARNGPYGITR
ncbi:unnamed protein product [Candida verbasci]|uniref:PH-response regulator protein palI/RIM9 n=1 Tax=Candida verbasci TaxID=1227364 RepID=A0A9W4TTI4_9ASCO|nr:unnamed protein product [Candida verbasci]